MSNIENLIMIVIARYNNGGSKNIYWLKIMNLSIPLAALLLNLYA
ncbi:hypothetical protein [Pantoea sp. S62]|nr:hypothetical protein [Pantoea sp. S62]MBK5016609.1 hypothetical protein [Pantoea sp. S62]